MDYALIALFFSSFLSATLLPGASEISLIAALTSGESPAIAIAVATAGNSLGSLFTFQLGRLGKLQWASKYLRIREEKVHSLKGRVQRFGSSLSLLCFLPVIGDPLALSLGYFQVNSVKFSVFMSIGKLLRFIVIYYGWYMAAG